MAATASRLRFAIEWNGTSREFAIRVGEAISIGRSPCCGIIIEDSCVSSNHVQLQAIQGQADASLRLCGRDMSRNGTGILDRASSSSGDPDVRRLRSDREEELSEGVELIVPLTRSQSKEDGTRARLVVRLLSADKPSPLPSDGPRASNSAVAAACARVARTARQPATASVLAAAGVYASAGFSADDPHSVAAFALAAETPCLPVGGARPLPRSIGKGAAHQSADGQGANGGLDAAGLPDAYNPVTSTGRWRYENRLGEGGLGVVYRAIDRKGNLGEVAVKVLKRNARFPKRDARHAFAMHRESQWSLCWLHNEKDSRYRAEPAGLFARYLEDHTGFSEMEPKGFEEKRRRYEAPDFDWDVDGPSLPANPYVVMELVKGEALQVAIDRERRSIVDGVEEPPALSTDEKRSVIVQASLALEYLELFSLIHRDFRGCNMHLISRASGENSTCKLKVLDLGVMILAEDGQDRNSNSAVQAFRRRGATEEKRRRYDWLPWEVRDAADGKGPAVNFRMPPHSFDVFSLGVLVLHLLVGKTEARAILDTIHEDPRIGSPAPLGLDARLLLRMLSTEAAERPHPAEVLDALEKRGFLSKRTPLRPIDADVRPQEESASSSSAAQSAAPIAEEPAASAPAPVPVSPAPPLAAVPVETPGPSAPAVPSAPAQTTVPAEAPKPDVARAAPARASGNESSPRAGIVTLLSSSPRSCRSSPSRRRSRSRSGRRRKKRHKASQDQVPASDRGADRSRSRSRERTHRSRHQKSAPSNNEVQKPHCSAELKPPSSQVSRSQGPSNQEAQQTPLNLELRQAISQVSRIQGSSNQEAQQPPVNLELKQAISQATLKATAGATANATGAQPPAPAQASRPPMPPQAQLPGFHAGVTPNGGVPAASIAAGGLVAPGAPQAGGVLAGTTPKGSMPTAPPSDGPLACAVPKGGGMQSMPQFPPSVLPNLSLPTSPLLGMPLADFQNQQLRPHLQQALAFQQAVMGFTNGLPPTLPWGPLQAQSFQTSMPPQSSAIAGTTRVVRPGRASTNGHWPW